MLTRSPTGRLVPGAVRPGTGWRLIWALLIMAAILDLARCTLVLITFRHLALAVGLVTAGMAAAGVSVTTARGYRAGRRWAGLAAVLIGVASAPLASASGFRTPFTILDVATSILGIALAVAVLAAVGRGSPGQEPAGPCSTSAPDDLE